MAKKIGKQTIQFDKNINICTAASIVGPYEGQGPLKQYFDLILEDDTCGQDSYEKAETSLLEKAYETVLNKSALSKNEIDLIIGGDLLNQIIATTFAVEKLDIPYWGIYGACSTFALSMQIAAMTIESGAIQKSIISASSHFSSAERQYRTPLELGVQPPPSSQRTVTGAGSCLISNENNPPYIRQITIGKVVDFDIKDPFDMGTAMAPAAADTILTHFKDTSTTFRDYDLVLTGDLAEKGIAIVKDMLKIEGYEDYGNFNDCGQLIYDKKTQNVNCGGSGCGCSASVFSGYVFKMLKEEKLNRILFIPTGALLSPTSYLQKQSIPCIAHALVISNQ